MTRSLGRLSLPSIGTLDRRTRNLSRQLAHALRVASRRGELREGEALPSSRALANTLGIARGTVVEAFDQLVAEGFLDTRRGSSTRVARSTIRRPNVRKDDGAAPARRTRALPAIAITFSGVAQQFASQPSVPFAISVPTNATAPGEAWRRIGNRLRARGPAAPAGYGDPQGAVALRAAIAEYVRRSRSVRCDARQVIITSGTQQGLYLAAHVLVGPHDSAWIENPAYRALTGIFASMGRQMVRVAVDNEGLDVDAGRARARDAAAAFVTPSHQYPLGMPMSMPRRTALLDWAQTNGTWIVEDDYDAEMRYAGHPFPSLQGLAREHVVYLGTFSKVLFPSLRLGYAIVPDPLVEPFLGARILIDRHPPTDEQHVLAAFIDEGHLDRHIRRMRTVYADQRAHLVGLLQRLLPANLGRVQPCDQGMHMIVWLRDDADDRAVAAAARQHGVVARPVSPMYAEGTKRQGLLLGFGGFTGPQIESAAHRLANVIERSSKKRGTPKRCDGRAGASQKDEGAHRTT